MDLAEVAGVILAVAGVLILTVAAGITFGMGAALTVAGASALLAGLVVVRAAAINAGKPKDVA